MLDASESHPRRPNAKEVLTPKRSDLFIFPIPDGNCLEEIIQSTLREEQPERSEDFREELQGNSEVSQPTEQKMECYCYLRSVPEVLADGIHLPTIPLSVIRSLPKTCQDSTSFSAQHTAPRAFNTYHTRKFLVCTWLKGQPAQDIELCCSLVRHFGFSHFGSNQLVCGRSSPSDSGWDVSRA